MAWLKPEQQTKMKEMFGKFSVKEIAEHFKITTTTVYQRAKAWGIDYKQKETTMNKTIDQEIQELLENNPGMTLIEALRKLADNKENNVLSSALKAEIINTLKNARKSMLDAKTLRTISIGKLKKQIQELNKILEETELDVKILDLKLQLSGLEPIKPMTVNEVAEIFGIEDKKKLNVLLNQVAKKELPQRFHEEFFGQLESPVIKAIEKHGISPEKEHLKQIFEAINKLGFN